RSKRDWSSDVCSSDLVLRPLDLMQPYRLEMGVKLDNPRGKNLYEFWGDLITRQIEKDMRAAKTDTLVNLASNEYFKSIKPKQLQIGRASCREIVKYTG